MCDEDHSLTSTADFWAQIFNWDGKIIFMGPIFRLRMSDYNQKYLHDLVKYLISPALAKMIIKSFF